MIKRLLKKLFITKEIRDRNNELYFIRYRLFSCPWFRLYIHKIFHSDEDLDKHSHPWDFYSLLLKGSYSQEYVDYFGDPEIKYQECNRFDIVKMNRKQAHKITLKSPYVYTFVIAYSEYSSWGYYTKDGIVDNMLYRKLKRQ